MAFGDSPKIKSPLGRHRVLSPNCGVKVSPICLGAMNFGNAWKAFMGECDKDTSFAILDYFYDQGGNFIDTSSNYQDEESEIWLGEWMKTRNNRDEMVIATKFTTGFRTTHEDQIQSNFGGNSTKGMRHAVDASLKKLQTDYIDILYVHWWDYTTSVEELVQSLNQLVTAGKVLYLGISDTPAWIVAKANEYAKAHGLRGFSVYQGQWSAADRDFEREIIPMAVAEGLALVPWGALGGGQFKPKELRDSKEGRNFGAASEAKLKVADTLEEIANRKKVPMTSVALAYVMHKAPYTFPIVGGRKVEHLKSNIEALSLALSKEDIQEIEDATHFEYGFPLGFLTRENVTGFNNPADIWLSKMTGTFDYPERPKPIAPHKGDLKG